MAYYRDVINAASEDENVRTLLSLDTNARMNSTGVRPSAAAMAAVADYKRDPATYGARFAAARANDPRYSR
jgi:hypothetical protein